MKKYALHFFVILAAFSLSSCGYNTMVSKEETITGKWSQVENQYQRRADLIPNLVNTVKGYAEFEKGTLTQVIEARAKATQVRVDPGDLSPENIQKFQAAQDQLGASLGRLLAVAEAYPNLKANEGFQDLRVQLEGTENRIAVARQDFNTAVQDYNTYVRSFPNNLFAGMFGFKQKGYFQAQPGSEKVPEVKF
jgi:LemA protein